MTAFVLLALSSRAFAGGDPVALLNALNKFSTQKVKCTFTQNGVTRNYDRSSVQVNEGLTLTVQDDGAMDLYAGSWRDIYTDVSCRNTH